jgi:two-component system, OmpR family, phosphate regulon sensor histidine kinase PhoR
MADGEEPTGRRRTEGAWARLHAARVPLAAAALALALACALWPVPVAYGLAAFGAIVLVTALVPRRAPVAHRAAARDRAVRPIWPDTSMKAVAEATPCPVFVLDTGGVLRFANSLARREFPAARPGDPLTFTFRSPQLVEALRGAARGEGATIPYRERGDPERVYSVAISPVRLPNASAAFTLVTLDDVTEQLALARMRADFVANASHELRTPLASLTGFIETLMGPARADAAATERFLRIMLEQAERMRRLIDDLLSLSRLEMRAHRRPTETVDLVAVVRHVLDALSRLAEAQKVRVLFEPSDAALPVRGDRDELVQVFSNLIENGLKYGADGGHLEVRLTRGVHAGRDMVRAEVRDFGPGVPREHLLRLTERFYRVDVASSRAMQGTGLGLAIVKHILARHEGRLEFASAPGEGMLVRIELPGPDAAPDTGADRHMTVMEAS